MEDRTHTRVRSGIRLDAAGRFWHDGEPVLHPAIARAWQRGIERGPDGRYLIRFGADWAYIHVEDAPYVVRRVVTEADGLRLLLSDDSSELLQHESLARSREGVVYCRVKGDHRARFSRQAQADLAPHLIDRGGRFALELAGEEHPIGDDPGQPPPRPEDGPAPPDEVAPA